VVRTNSAKPALLLVSFGCEPAKSQHFVNPHPISFPAVFGLRWSCMKLSMPRQERLAVLVERRDKAKERRGSRDLPGSIALATTVIIRVKVCCTETTIL
jgi:hypothetical protein